MHRKVGQQYFTHDASRIQEQVGLAVENIQEFHKEADLAKKEIQVKFALELERILTSFLISKGLNFLRCNRSAKNLSKTETLRPNKQNWLQRKVAESWKLTEKDINMALRSEQVIYNVIHDNLIKDIVSEIFRPSPLIHVEKLAFTCGEQDGTSKEIARLETKFNTLETNMTVMDSKLETISQTLSRVEEKCRRPDNN